ncbi:hypothetical protein [Photobacterium leiognathi]|uniref:hypothetical protein n=1 Tax=Photobacterium leiognathi TaxID=553611 RepID=UPI002734FE04|nr:hypothetical protein [Photobacterium leiognathi]
MTSCNDVYAHRTCKAFFLILMTFLTILSFSYALHLTLQKSDIGLFFLITMSGALGGIVTSLESDVNHTFSVPLTNDTFKSGFIGHAFIGICGGYVGVGLALLLTPFEIELFLSADKPKLIKPIFILVSVCIIGGFSGLPIISKLSSQAIKKLEKELDQEKIRNVEQEKQIEKSFDKIKTNEERLEEQFKKYEELYTQQLYTSARLHVQSEQYPEAEIKLKELKEKNAEITKTSKFWVMRAYNSKRLGHLNLAIEYIDKAIDIDPKEPLSYFNKACYEWLQSKNEEKTISLIRTAKDLLGSDFAKLKTNLEQDEDLKDFRTTGSYQGLF